MKINFTRFLLSAAFVITTAAHADTLTGRVVGIADGDTLTVLDASNTQHKIRLSGIDSPEKGQPFGQVCKQSLSDLAYGRVVAVEASKLDRYGRVIGKVLVDGEDASLEQIRRGCGWHYKRYQNEQILDDRLAYSRVEESARASRVGLWTDHEAVPPWEWRKAGRK
ncbi:MAG: thermonuclease family protein [Thiobacillus sp.]|jgi:endonuclease YncB( thermonuclease family)|uniref:thermonuclease family protein n=1 Tax=Thiobacillus sp. TaxID=924 RepID=UPI002895C50B|nr:thermonuclease family protein [Thiobacillus sp.]MDT3708287.1 thermonuclease family protein [Thiobacillus sp.]